LELTGFIFQKPIKVSFSPLCLRQ